MAYIPVDDKPTLNLNMDSFEATTPVHYDQMNLRHKQHLNNEKALLEQVKLKVAADAGDTAATIVSNINAVSTEFPIPVAGESTKTLWGKVKKFFEDTKSWMAGVCLIGQIVNNCVTNRSDLPGSAAQLKVLMDLYTQLNSDLIVENISSKIFAITVTEIIQLTARRFQSMCFASFTIKVSADTLSGLSFFSLDSSITPSVPAEGIAISADNEPALAHSISVSNAGVIRFTAVRANNIYNGSQIKGQIVWFI